MRNRTVAEKQMFMDWHFGKSLSLFRMFSSNLLFWIKHETQKHLFACFLLSTAFSFIYSLGMNRGLQWISCWCTTFTCLSLVPDFIVILCFPTPERNRWNEHFQTGGLVKAKSLDDMHTCDIHECQICGNMANGLQCFDFRRLDLTA